ncbi:hypothetical protein Desor_2294 [Desulfosporosinus orientis DSM 765]|uniref:LemA family protein n=1 Tax=Desulfosporosinus orientis (strain ATCC 19365 / DSM 765 / NCIMB 8382 / VKM B-1628 / Singapore I) TaxID=768706 RepID=G7WBA9_DESOD|nr:LemA family protein [Desulfosporosinus orientis]AET67890.1 hypothetical protein Desor_2294 [Desulfosporosinus orientis DSM 765]
MWILLIILAALIIWWISAYNSFRRKDNKIQESLSGVEVALTKRYDMLTKLLDTAKGFMEHETQLFSQVIRLRQGMSAGELEQAGAKVDEMAARLKVAVEAYPELRSVESVTKLQSGIGDAEDQLQAARRLYNSNVNAFNTYLDVFPSSLVGRTMKLEKRQLFAAEEDKKQDVKIEF